MKKGNLLIIILGCCLVFTSCKKEEIVRLDADIENYSGQKAFIDNQDFSCFAAGDKVNINGGEYTVSGITNGGRNVTFDVTSASGYKAVFPSTLTTNLAAINSSTVTVNLPSSQAYTTENGSQKIDIPMCGYLATAGGSIHFRNLCALLEITITSGSNEVLYFDRIEVSTSNCPLSGSGYIDDITSATPSIVMNSGSSKSVALTFGSEQTLANGASKTYYVIIPKTTEETGATSFKISLSAKGSTRSSISRIYYERTKSSAFTFNRNKIYPITFSSPTKREVDYYFTVNSSGKKVIFSPGNLQWSYTGGGNSKTIHNVAGGGTADGTWRFAEEQWNLVGFDSKPSGNISGSNNKYINNCTTDYKGWIDMFGFGTSGYDNKHPYLSSTSNDKYINNNLSGTYSNYDWGVYNDINNPVNNRTESKGTWRTLSYTEWDYIVNSRSTSKRGTATVNSVRGVVILPDNWPSGLAALKSSYTSDEWVQMENNGAVFMPSCGRRKDASQDDNYYAFRYKCVERGSHIYYNQRNNGTIQSSANESNFYGMTVRLVKDYTPGQ